MNVRTIKLSATLGAVALAFSAPAIASAQDQVMPASSNSDQLDKLQAMGFVNQSSILTAHVNPNLPGSFAPIPSDQLNAALDSVKVDDADGITSTLGEYLNSQGIDPSSIVGVNVTDNAIVIAHT